jgi:hypothetical protein
MNFIPKTESAHSLMFLGIFTLFACSLAGPARSVSITPAGSVILPHTIRLTAIDIIPQESKQLSDLRNEIAIEFYNLFTDSSQYDKVEKELQKRSENPDLRLKRCPLILSMNLAVYSYTKTFLPYMSHPHEQLAWSNLELQAFFVIRTYNGQDAWAEGRGAYHIVPIFVDDWVKIEDKLLLSKDLKIEVKIGKYSG